MTNRLHGQENPDHPESQERVSLIAQGLDFMLPEVHTIDPLDRHIARGYEHGLKYGSMTGDVTAIAEAEVARRLTAGRQIIDCIDDRTIQTLFTDDYTSANVEEATVNVLIAKNSTKRDYTKAKERMQKPELPLMYVELEKDHNFDQIEQAYTDGYTEGHLAGTIEAIEEMPVRMKKYEQHIEELLKPDSMSRDEQIAYRAYEIASRIEEISRDFKTKATDEYIQEARDRLRESLSSLASLVQKSRLNRINKSAK